MVGVEGMAGLGMSADVAHVRARDVQAEFEEGFAAVMPGQEAGGDEQEALRQVRDAFLNSLLAKRREAVQGREASGIEDEWTEDEEHYQGIDDANRHLHPANHLGRRRDRLIGASQGSRAVGQGSRSLVFPNITRPYCEAASARVSDILLPTDDRAWEIKPTPLPNLSLHQLEQLAQLLGADDPAQAQAMLDARRAEAKTAAEKMQQAIDDRLIESNWHGEVRQVIEDAARIGSGVLKGPFPVRRTARVTRRDPLSGRVEFVRLSEIQPGSKRVDPWNVFPDPSCGENIHNGSYIWERELISRRQVQELLEVPGYDREQLRAALREGPTLLRQGLPTLAKASEDEFEMWIFHGHCASEHLRLMGVELDEDAENRLPAMAVLIGDRIVKITLSIHDSGVFPYDVLAWQRRPGLPWGAGVARQIRTAQRMLTGSVRAMMDNLGLSSAPQIVYSNSVVPEDGSYELRPGKAWRMRDDSMVHDVRAAFASFTVTNVQQPLMAAIEFALKMAEDTTGMPAMIQGIRGDAPDTLGGMQMQHSNATSVLRRIAKRFDDYITAPHIERYYDWMMQYSDDDSIKGDCQIDVRASSVLLERDAQQQFMTQMLALARDPAYGVEPHRLMAELVKSQRMDPERFMLSDEQMAAKMQQLQQAQQQPDPADQARAEYWRAQAQRLQAQSELDRARIDETRAKTATKNVEGMFSATQAARNIAEAAPLAGAADAIWKSAGGEDHDLPPAIAPMPDASRAMPAGAPPVANTNPLTPVNPEATAGTPAQGLLHGIEGGGG